jgi:hypothetical protein
MLSSLETALQNLLESALPDLFGGNNAPVSWNIANRQFQVDKNSLEPAAGEPRTDDHVDTLPFNAATPAGPYTLTQSPSPGPRRISLVTGSGDRIPLREEEVVWNLTAPREFTLALRPSRDVTGITSVRALYGVTAVFTRIKALYTCTAQMEANSDAQLNQAESLVIAVLVLHRESLMAAAQTSFTDGNYSSAVVVENLYLTQGVRTTQSATLTLSAAIELKASRALEADEGRPITKILTPGRPLDPNRPVDVFIEVDA